MREIFQNYAKTGAMTPQELALVLRRKVSWVLNNSRGASALIPRLPGKPIRFDPIVMIDVFCQPLKPVRAGSLTIERHKTGAKPIGGYRKCL
jgi:hypothetical protein